MMYELDTQGGKAQYVGVHGSFDEITLFAVCPKHVPLPELHYTLYTNLL